jgi:uncharacterized membrane protein SpoIIM required for sporulation
VFSFWKSTSSRSRRFLTILTFFALSIVITVAGVLTPLSLQESNDLGNQLKQTEEDVKKMDVLHGAVYFFSHNFLICLVMFVPIVGPLFGSYVFYNTGLVLSAETNVAAADNTMHVSPLLVFFLLFLFPHTWLEFIAYSAALAASVWLTWRIIQRKIIGELSRTAIFIGICALLLFVAGILEAAVIALLA